MIAIKEKAPLHYGAERCSRGAGIWGAGSSSTAPVSASYSALSGTCLYFITGLIDSQMSKIESCKPMALEAVEI